MYVEDSVVENDNQIKLTMFKESVIDEHDIKVEEKKLVKDNCDIDEENKKSITEDIEKEKRSNTEIEGAIVAVERSATATITKPTPLPHTMK